MTPERWEQIRKLFHAALEQNLTGSESQCEAFLRQACPDDELMRREVNSLLEHEHSAENFLAAPPAVSASTFMTQALQSLVGRQIGSYQILSRLGAGGMGEVYRAHDSKLRRDVAIKVMPHVFLADAERLARFEREARVLAALNHPNIGAIYGLEDAGDAGRGLVLELVEGPTLADRLSTGPLPMTEALTVARQIVDALEAAHEKGIVHRDLKPANIKIAPDGLVKVLDFGLAKANAGDVLAKDASLAHAVTEAGTRDGIVVGNGEVESPEQANQGPLPRLTHALGRGASITTGSSVTEPRLHVTSQCLLRALGA